MDKCMIFHHNDLDGLLGGGIAYHAQLMRGYDSIYAYSCKFPTTIEQFHTDEIDKNTIVYIIDYSFSLETFDVLKQICDKAGNVVWLDHHKTSLDASEKLTELYDTEKVSHVIDISKCGALLTWEYFYPGIKVPRSVILTDDYDRWVGKIPESKLFNDGMYAQEDFRKVSSVLYYRLAHDQEDIDAIINEGRVIQKYNTARYKAAMYASYEKIIEVPSGKYKCIIMNSDGNSLAFGDQLKNYDIGMLWKYNGSKYVYSLYSVKDNIDCSIVAQELGVGGGHKGAAGFTTDTQI